MWHDSVAAEKRKKLEQKIIFSADQVFYGTSTGLQQCQKQCSSHSNDVKQFMNDGWRVISSTSKELVVEDFKKGVIPSFRWGAAGEKEEPARPYSYGCKCIGTEYIIEK